MRQAGVLVEVKVASLPNVREWCEGLPVEVWINRAGRLVLRALNEDGHNSTDVDVFDFMAWLNGDNNGFIPTTKNGNGALPVA